MVVRASKLALAKPTDEVFYFNNKYNVSIIMHESAVEYESDTKVHEKRNTSTLSAMRKEILK
ncbi:MAG: hypothetical protein K6E85_09300 [Lachnospiraceae bacterium]|nr:hypothetical protein [Lachnospiraceae bacterium]